MRATAALISLLIIGFLVSSGAAGFISYSMVQEINRKRSGHEKLRKWNRDLIGIVLDYRTACPNGRLFLPLVGTLLLVLVTGAGLAAASVLIAKSAN